MIESCFISNKLGIRPIGCACLGLVSKLGLTALAQGGHLIHFGQLAGRRRVTKRYLGQLSRSRIRDSWRIAKDCVHLTANLGDSAVAGT